VLDSAAQSETWSRVVFRPAVGTTPAQLVVAGALSGNANTVVTLALSGVVTTSNDPSPIVVARLNPVALEPTSLTLVDDGDPQDTNPQKRAIASVTGLALDDVGGFYVAGEHRGGRLGPFLSDATNGNEGFVAHVDGTGGVRFAALSGVDQQQVSDIAVDPLTGDLLVVARTNQSSLKWSVFDVVDNTNLFVADLTLAPVSGATSGVERLVVLRIDDRVVGDLATEVVAQFSSTSASGGTNFPDGAIALGTDGLLHVVGTTQQSFALGSGPTTPSTSGFFDGFYVNITP
jgi:hypothetical protein